MAESPDPLASPEAVPLDRDGRGVRRGMTGIEFMAILASIAWLAFVAIVVSLAGGATSPEFDGRHLLVLGVTAFVPVALIWLAAAVARTNRSLREETQNLRREIDDMKGDLAKAIKSAGALGTRETAQTAPAATEPVTTFASMRRAAVANAATDTAAPVAPQAAPAESPQAPAADLSTEDFIRAMHFPETPDDNVGFEALRRALMHPDVGALVHASQDVLTLLSQDGIYMDDLQPDLANPDVWRQFAKGTRGRAISGLGGVRDRSSLALTAARIKEDTIFRDAAHHFIRLFDKRFVAFEETARDVDIRALSETRTARAFMLLGRVAGTFN